MNEPIRSSLVGCALLAAVGCSAAPATVPNHAAAGAKAPTGPSNPTTLTPAEGAAMSQPMSPIVAMSKPVSTKDDCNMVAIDFAPKVPSVFILVDRSSSMFEHSLWEPLKKGVLAVIDQLDSEMRFGFSSYTGERGKTCPELSMIVPVAKDNYPAIERAYNGIQAPMFKGETPTAAALTQISQMLEAPKDQPDTFTRDPRYIVLVTDGEPDFCDDPNVTCSRDAVVAAVQQANANGVGTFVFSIGGQVERAHLADVANAGVGNPVEDHQMAVMYQCPEKRGTYTPGATDSAPFFEPDVNDQKALVTALTSAIAGVRSCIFDLQGKVKIDLSMADQGLVTIDGAPVKYGAPDGFRMNTPTQLELLGASCMHLKQPETLRVAIDFPCKAIELF